MRKDAQNRRNRIIAATARVFAREGYAVALETIAREAGVGRSTLYRNFADRCELAVAVMERHILDVASVAEQVQDRTDGFFLMLETMCEGRTDHGALATAVAAQHGDHGRRSIATLRKIMEDVRAPAVSRAKEGHLIRDDFELIDFHRLTLMLAAGASEWEPTDRNSEFRRTLLMLSEGLCPRVDQSMARVQ